jgi:site-specific DNA-cytosine methylase
LKVLIACEYSGVVREAFRKQGHDATSCDLLPTEVSGSHYTGSVLDILYDGWDLLIAHPPCTHLAVSGARWFKDKQQEQAEALEFVRVLLNAPIRRKCVENPVSIISSRIRKPSQVIQPWWFGEPAFKATCLWLEGLPLLAPTNKLTPPAKGTPEHKAWSAIHLAPPGPDRWKFRSRTFQGIADAMASQWGSL